MSRSVWLGCLALLCLPACTSPYAALTGKWFSDWSEVVFHDNHGRYSDTYGTGPGTIDLTRSSDRIFTGRWGESEKRHGTMTLTLSEDGRTLTGVWETDRDVTIGGPGGGAIRWTKKNTNAADSAVIPAPASRTLTRDATRTITEADCTAGRLGRMIPRSLIGEPVSGVTLSEPKWIPASDEPKLPAYCTVDGSIAPVDTAPTAKPINFRVVLPQVWRYHTVQYGGSGMNGSVCRPGSFGQWGFAAYCSDSGHQGEPRPITSQDWALNDEAIRNLGYMQMKKTHDAAMAVIERMYGERPRFNYYFGMSQGGREGLMVAQRYPADYDGVAAFVPAVGFSSLMLAPVWIRIQERQLARWVPPAKTTAIRSEFIRQCDKLDGLADGIINNYRACRAVFDVGRQPPGRGPWASKRCPGNRDPAPADTSSQACLSDGQIATLEFVYSHHRFATPLANGWRSFGMWLPNVVDPSEGLKAKAEDWGLQLIQGSRFKGQEGAPEGASVFSHIGAAGVVGFLMHNLLANPLDYVEGETLDARRREISTWLDATDPDLRSFYKRGGKLIVLVGTNDTMASSGEQLDYLQALIETMGQPTVDAFARLFVVPQADHGLTGQNYDVNGDGKKIPVVPIPTPNFLEGFQWLVDWVENNTTPSQSPTVTTEDKSRSLPLCCYPMYPQYVQGPTNLASSYRCALP